MAKRAKKKAKRRTRKVKDLVKFQRYLLNTTEWAAAEVGKEWIELPGGGEVKFSVDRVRLNTYKWMPPSEDQRMRRGFEIVVDFTHYGQEEDVDEYEDALYHAMDNAITEAGLDAMFKVYEVEVDEGSATVTIIPRGALLDQAWGFRRDDDLIVSEVAIPEYIRAQYPGWANLAANPGESAPTARTKPTKAKLLR